MKTREQWVEIARGNIERHLGDVTDPENTPDRIYEEAYVLAFDALHDAQCPKNLAIDIALELAMCHAQP